MKTLNPCASARLALGLGIGRMGPSRPALGSQPALALAGSSSSFWSPLSPNGEDMDHRAVEVTDEGKVGMEPGVLAGKWSSPCVGSHESRPRPSHPHVRGVRRG